MCDAVYFAEKILKNFTATFKKFYIKRRYIYIVLQFLFNVGIELLAMNLTIDYFITI